MDRFLYALSAGLLSLVPAALIGPFLLWRKKRLLGWVTIAVGTFWFLLFLFIFWSIGGHGGPHVGGTGAFGKATEQNSPQSNGWLPTTIRSS